MFAGRPKAAGGPLHLFHSFYLVLIGEPGRLGYHHHPYYREGVTQVANRDVMTSRHIPGDSEGNPDGFPDFKLDLLGGFSLFADLQGHLIGSRRLPHIGDIYLDTDFLAWLNSSGRDR